MAGIGNAIVQIRSQDDRPAVRVQVHSRVSETTGLLLKSSILCWNFVIATFTIHQWRSHVIFHSTFLVRVCQFPLGKKNANRAAGLLNQGRRAVAGLK